MTLTFKLDLQKVRMNQRAEYLGLRSFNSKVIVRTQTQTHTHTGPTALPGSLKWSVKTRHRRIIVECE